MGKHKIGLLILILTACSRAPNAPPPELPELPEANLINPYDDFDNDWWSDREELATWDRY